MNSLPLYNVHGFVIGDGGKKGGFIGSYNVISFNMDPGEITEGAVFFDPCNAKIGIYADNVGIAEIPVVTVGKIIVPAFYGKITYAVTVQDIDLHSVIGYEQMASPFHDLVAGIIKQIVDVKGINDILAVIIEEKFVFNINRVFDI